LAIPIVEELLVAVVVGGESVFALLSLGLDVAAVLPVEPVYPSCAAKSLKPSLAEYVIRLVKEVPLKETVGVVCPTGE
jgi:hypothetical protein